MSWTLKKQLQDILQAEQGARVYAPGSRAGFALVYPNQYQVGMSNLGFHIIYDIINKRGDTACERVFLPDAATKKEYTRTNTPLMTIENQISLYEFNLIGFAVSFEMDYFNLLEMLKLSKIELLANERGEQDPIIIMGGPCATFNPEPMAAFIDVFIIGEGEETINELLDVYYDAIERGLSRREVLYLLSKVEGIYVPRFYEPVYKTDATIAYMNYLDEVPRVINRRWVHNLDDYPAHTVVFTRNTEFKDMFLVEVARGCGRHCRFCMAGYCFRNPRVRSLNKIEETINKAGEYKSRVGLMGAAISDYPEIDALCNYIIDKDMTMSVASLRADSLTSGLTKSLAESGHKTMTIAPEAGSIRMRNIINKGITDEDIHKAVYLAIKEGIMHIRMYIMVGLPFETDEDITEIVNLAVNVRKQMKELGSKGHLTLSINPFIPKPFTPFQWLPMSDAKTVQRRIEFIKRELKSMKGIEVLAESIKEAYIQGVLARGDRLLSNVILKSVQSGGVKAWRKIVKELNFDEGFYLYRTRTSQEVFPWEHLDMGVNKKYLWQELEKAECEEKTMRCIDGCKRCGVCGGDV